MVLTSDFKVDRPSFCAKDISQLTDVGANVPQLRFLDQKITAVLHHYKTVIGLQRHSILSPLQFGGR